MMKVKAIKEKINALKDEQKSLLENAIEEVRGQSDEEKDSYEQINKEIQELEDLLAKANEERFNPENKIVEKMEERKMENKELMLQGLKDVLAHKNTEAANEYRAYPTTAGDINGLGGGSTHNAGQNIVPTTISDIILTKMEEYSDVFNVVKKIPTTVGDLALPARVVNGDCAFVGENAALGAIKVEYKVIKMTQKRCGAFLRVTRQLLNDSAFDIVSQCLEVLAEEMAIALEKAIFQGDGTTSFKGLCKFINASEGAISESDLAQHRYIERVENASAEAITADDLMKLYLHLHPSYVANAKFYVSREIFNKIAMIKDGNGNFLLQSGVINGRPGYTLFGAPVVVTNLIGINTASSDSKLLGYFGDLSKAYGVMIKQGMNIATVNNDTEAVMYATELIAVDMFADGTVLDPQAVVAFAKNGEM